MRRQQEQPLGYEEALRVIGRHLDMEPAYQMNIRETAEGFSLQYRPTSSLSEERSVEYTWERLRDLVIFHSSGRGSPRKRGRYHGIWARFPNGHQGFLRALGFNLDQIKGSDLVIEERDDGVRVSHRKDGGSERTETVYTESDIRTILEDAEQRRDSNADLVPS